MQNKMLIDALHPEETRIVVLRGNRVEEFDFEAANRKQLRGNIYLAKVTRVEPSLQAAFIEYGGNRHGFLAFSEIHPDYYKISLADRQALLEDEARAHSDEEDDEGREARRSRRHKRGERSERGEGEARSRQRDETRVTQAVPATESDLVAEHQPETRGDDEPHAAASPGEPPQDATAAQSDAAAPHEAAAHDALPADAPGEEPAAHEPAGDVAAASHDAAAVEPVAEAAPQAETLEAAPTASDEAHEEPHEHDEPAPIETIGGKARTSRAAPESADHEEDEEDAVEHMGGDAMEEVPNRAPRHRKQYKIQEVIKRHQVLLVQVVKEERGNKGAALTTYLSLAGRYSVLMPNTARGGGISRKITDGGDRKRLKSIVQELEVPEGMGIILRTAGASRTKPEVNRDFDYLLRMWETVRELTLRSMAPSLVYEEGSLIKRAIRDLYNSDIEEILVAGDAGFREARDFMGMLMPTHAKHVVHYSDSQPIFAKFGVEQQLDQMFSNQVTLRSGGYIVINQTEALVAIDVNSGRSTREHNIEDTALRTNLEAADEVARQLRLRDLAGLIVVDFIDMDENRNNRAVERRIKDALADDRARIQIGRISHFGLLEMSRQRMRTGVLEGSTAPCPHCAGAGMVRSTASIALHVLRVLEDNLIRNAAFDMIVRTRTVVALYILNQKRDHLRDLEARFGVTVTVAADESLTGMVYHAFERGETASPPPAAPRTDLVRIDSVPPLNEDVLEDELDADDDEAEAVVGAAPLTAESAAEAEEVRRKRRRRRRRGRGVEREGGPVIEANAAQLPDDALTVMATIGGIMPVEASVAEGEDDDEGAMGAEGEAGALPEEQRRRRRSRRGGRRNRRDGVEGERGTVTEAIDPSGAAVEAPVAAMDALGQEPVGAVEPAPVMAERDIVQAAEPAPLAPVTPAEAAQPVTATAVVEPDHAPSASGSAAHDAAPAAAAAPIEKPVVQPAPLADAAPGPKRGGWWQRAKASIGGA